jgi:Protein of unknown function (DUF1357).
MTDDYDPGAHIEDNERKAEALAEEFEEYNNFKDAIDALAQQQIVAGNEKQHNSDAKVELGNVDERERAADIRECDVRHEVAQALQNLLSSHGYNVRQSAGEDSDARQEE